MIQIFIIDPNLEIALPYQIERVISSVAEYVAEYDHIARCIHQGADLNILVTDKTVGRWLKIMAGKYGADRIELREITAQSVFQDQTGIKEIPIDVDDESLIRSGLLDLKIPAVPGTSFDDYLLNVFFGTFLTTPYGLRRIGEIIDSYEPDQWSDALKRPLVRNIFQNRVRELREEFESENRLAEKLLLEWLELSPQVLIRNLFALKVLSGYPGELGMRVFGEKFRDLLKLNLDLRKVPQTISGNEKTLDELRLYLENEISTAGEETLTSLLRQVSGLLEVEFDAIHELIEAGKYPITMDLVSEIQTIFGPLMTSPRIAQSLVDLDLLITKDPPSVPDSAWEIESWIKWAVEEYLPYRYWLENTGHLDDEIGEIAGQYADWLYEHYGQILYHSDRMAWKALHNLKGSLRESSGPALVIVVDNLNTKFYPSLRASLQHNGYYEHQMDYCLALLPSCTEVSKKSLITGHYAPFKETGYQSQVESVWSNRLGKQVRYLAGIGDLRAVSKPEHEVYFLNYLPLDITLHLNEDQTGMSHAQTIRGYLDMLAQDVRTFAKRLGAERDLMVVIASDHGSTRIPKGTVNVIQGNFYRKRAEDEHHRYIAITAEEMGKLPENSKYDCYFFNKDTFNLQSNYLVARRLYRFLPTNDHAYIHGGLTPEETIVPLAIYKPVSISPKPLTLLLLDKQKIYIGTKLDLHLEITNVNNYACKEVTLGVIDENIIAERHYVEEVPPLSRMTLSIPARCPSTADPTTKKLKTRVAFIFLGQPWELEIDIPVEFVAPARTKFDLDNL